MRASSWLALLLVLAQAGTGILRAETPAASAAASLHARYEALQDRLDGNPFQRQLVLDSTRAAERLEGDLYGVVDYPFATVRAALADAVQWCDVLVLHLNIKDCRVPAGGSRSAMSVYVGTKYYQPPETASRVDFAYRLAADTTDYLQIVLQADKGPFGTRNYEILFESVPLDGDRSFLHLSYSYAYGILGRMAMEAYLRTVGRSKVGFTVVDTRPGGQPVYVGGLRGVVERNAMRYYLAVIAYLGALSAPPPERFEKRLHDWFELTEQYALQLHELEEDEYLQIKRREHRWR